MSGENTNDHDVIAVVDTTTETAPAAADLADPAAAAAPEAMEATTTTTTPLEEGVKVEENNGAAAPEAKDVHMTDVAVPDTNAAAAAAAAAALAPSVSLVDANKRRFFPRVKLLLTREWEFFLQGILHSIESNGAQHAPAASHRPTNPWYRTFHSVYGGVAADCSVPTGKNRYHKFKDKIIELWEAMEEDFRNSGREERNTHQNMAFVQLQCYRTALEERREKRYTAGAASLQQQDAQPSPAMTTATTPAVATPNTTNTTSSTAPARWYMPPRGSRGRGAPPPSWATYSGGAGGWDGWYALCDYMAERLALERSKVSLPESLQHWMNIRDSCPFADSQDICQEHYEAQLEEFLQQVEDEMNEAQDDNNWYDTLMQLNVLAQKSKTESERKAIRNVYGRVLELFVEHDGASEEPPRKKAKLGDENNNNPAGGAADAEQQPTTEV